jgi:hypothetical protein
MVPQRVGSRLSHGFFVQRPLIQQLFYPAFFVRFYPAFFCPMRALKSGGCLRISRVGSADT